MARLSTAQQRLVEEIRRQGGADEYGAEYWSCVNDWVKDAGPAEALAFRNITRTVDCLLKKGVVTIDDDGYFHLTDKAVGLQLGREAH